MLGTLAAPSLLGSCTGSEGDKAAGISFAMNYFKVRYDSQLRVA